MKNLTTTRFARALLIASGMIGSHPCIAQTYSDATVLEITVSPELVTVPCPQSKLTQASLPRSTRASKVLVPATYTSSPITLVNGQVAHGSFIDTLGWWFPTNTAGSSYPPPPARAVPDPPAPATTPGLDTWTGLETWTFDLRQADGTPIGTITASSSPGVDGFSITSGTGAYFGVQGFVTSELGSYQSSWPATGSHIRYGNAVFQLTLYPMVLPSVAVSPAGPAVVHGADSSQVSVGFPAYSGEVLTVYALNLLPQPQDPSAALPISVTMGGIDAPVLWSGHYPNSQDGYQINLRVPPGLNFGLADLRISSGYIAGPSVQVYVGSPYETEQKVR